MKESDIAKWLEARAQVSGLDSNSALAASLLRDDGQMALSESQVPRWLNPAVLRHERRSGDLGSV